MNREAVCVAFTFIDLQKKNASVCLIVSVCKSVRVLQFIWVNLWKHCDENTEILWFSVLTIIMKKIQKRDVLTLDSLLTESI